MEDSELQSKLEEKIKEGNELVETLKDFMSIPVLENLQNELKKKSNFYSNLNKNPMV